MTDPILGTFSRVVIQTPPPATTTARIPLPAGPVIRGPGPPSVAEPAASGPPLAGSPPSPASNAPPPNPIEEGPEPAFGFARPTPTENEGSPDQDGPLDPTDSSDSQAGSTSPEEESPERTRPGGLTEGEYRELQQLKIQDRQVRQHEMAHIAAGGRYVTGGPSYRFVTGPDGRQYAVAGEVSIDTSKEPTPEQTLIKAQVIRRAALAPPEPSSQDRSVAAQATRLEAEARREILEARIEEIGEARSTEDSDVQAVPEDFEFTRIGPEEEEPQEPRARPPITAIPVPLPPEARADIGQLIDFRG